MEWAKPAATAHTCSQRSAMTSVGQSTTLVSSLGSSSRRRWSLGAAVLAGASTGGVGEIPSRPSAATPQAKTRPSCVSASECSSPAARPTTRKPLRLRARPTHAEPAPRVGDAFYTSSHGMGPACREHRDGREPRHATRLEHVVGAAVAAAAIGTAAP
eukprot:scaffold86255_cov31-Tisochrysis_lutea.AAC.2